MTRPDNCKTNRQAAYEAHERYYEGSPCGKCGGTKRYTSSSGCPVCVVKHTAKHRNDYGRYARHAVAIYEKDVSMKPLRPWPVASFEDAVTTDHLGTYRKQYHCPIQYAASANDMSEA